MTNILYPLNLYTSLVFTDMRIRGFRKGYNQTSLLDYRDYIEKLISLVLVDSFQLATRSSADPEGGGGGTGGPDPPPPLENHKLYGFLWGKVVNLLDRSRENLILLHANKSAYQNAHPQSDPRI